MIERKLAAAALKEVDTANFERFAQTLYGAMQDWEFVALGGMHDGGAEGFDASVFGSEIFKVEVKSSFIYADSFSQVAKQETTNKKLRDAVKRLRKYGSRTTLGRSICGAGPTRNVSPRPVAASARASHHAGVLHSMDDVPQTQDRAASAP